MPLLCVNHGCVRPLSTTNVAVYCILTLPSFNPFSVVEMFKIKPRVVEPGDALFKQAPDTPLCQPRPRPHARARADTLSHTHARTHAHTARAHTHEAESLLHLRQVSTPTLNLPSPSLAPSLTNTLRFTAQAGPCRAQARHEECQRQVRPRAAYSLPWTVSRGRRLGGQDHEGASEVC
jgi:hypothetical protein